MARRYSRDNRGRFASGGSSGGGGGKVGATARGGRLRTAAGNKRATQTTKAAAAKPSGTVAGKVKRNPAAAGKVGKAKAAAPSTKAKSPKFVTEQSGRVRRAALGGGRTAIVRANSATIINAKGEPIMTRKGLPNITAGKKWAANPNARGPRLMRNKFASEAAPSRDIARTSRPAGTIRKPRATTKAAAKPAKAATKPPAGSQAANKIELAKGRASVMQKQKDSQNKQLKEINAKIKEAGPNAGGLRLQKLQIQSRLQEARSNLAQAKAASRPDTAASNVPMRGARGRALNAEISRNVNAQKAASRAASKAIGRQVKSDQSRAKKLREVHLGPLAAGYAQRSGRKIADVKAAISGMAPSGQIKLFRQYVRENRKKK